MYVMKYPIKSKAADPILTIENDVLTLKEINEIFSSSISDQVRLCERLGISIFENSITITVKEKGKAYHIPDEDRTILSDHETSHEFKLDFSVANCEGKFPLPFSINFHKCSSQMFVNFLGEIVFKNDSQGEISVPLVGKGTAALEGRDDDAHAKPCCDGYFASFQQKVAIIMSILSYFHLNRDEIEILRAHLLKNCDKFYGRNDMLNYTCDKAFSLTNLSYFEYLKNIYSNEDVDNVPIMLQHFKEFFEPHPLYFEGLRETLTEEELNAEIKEISSDSKGPDKKTISLKVREIINRFMFLDEIYLIKPYSGENFQSYGNQEISIYHVADEINMSSLKAMKSALEKIGVIINQDKVKINFLEKGFKYKYENNKNILSDDETEDKFELSINISPTCENSLLNMKLYLDITEIDNVNFFGKIEIKTGFFSKIVVPLLGRGTIALDGRLNDKHAGFCTGSKSASFQQRVAILYCTLVLLKADQNELQRLESQIRNINNMYHGLQDIIDYTFKVIKQEETATFFQYMKTKYINYSKMPIGLKTILTYNRLPSRYFEELISKFTEEELIEEEKRLISIKFSNIIPKIIKKVNYTITKLNIF